MPWQCRMVEAYTGNNEVGDMRFDDDLPNRWPRSLSDNYKSTAQGKRAPLYVMTPAGPFCVDQSQVVNGEFAGGGWYVSGEAPNITVSPSINFPGQYHGWLQNGLLTDDCEGRRYD